MHVSPGRVQLPSDAPPRGSAYLNAPSKSQAAGKGEAVKVEAWIHMLIAVMNCPPLNSFRTSIIS